jgi:pyruvate dehydrogenase E2 component (dihydrolipoamide acetyltransferase)
VPTLIHMPAVAAGATDVVLAEWLVSEHSSFAAFDPYAVIETDKATVELEAEAAGVLLRTLVSPGARVEVGDPIALFGAPGEEVDDVTSVLESLGVATTPRTAPQERRDVPESATAAPAAQVALDGRRLFSSPLARRLARDAGLDHRELVGTGPGGRVVRRDVEQAIAARHTQAAAPVPPAATDTPAAPPPAPPASTPTAPGAPTADDTSEEPHSRIRRATATRLTRSKQEAPHFYVSGSARVDRLLALRREIEEAIGHKVSVNDLVVRAVGRAHELVPEMNVVWTDEAVVRHTRVDVGIAVATERGLMTPVVTDVTGRSLRNLAAATRDLTARAAEGRLRQQELEGGTIAVSNLGMYGVEEFSAIINPPHAAIIAVGAARQEPVVDEAVLSVGTVMRFVLSVDHRPVDGVVAARWVQAFTRLLEHPAGMLA